MNMTYTENLLWLQRTQTIKCSYVNKNMMAFVYSLLACSQFTHKRKSMLHEACWKLHKSLWQKCSKWSWTRYNFSVSRVMPASFVCIVKCIFWRNLHTHFFLCMVVVLPQALEYRCYSCCLRSPIRSAIRTEAVLHSHVKSWAYVFTEKRHPKLCACYSIRKWI